MSKALSRRSLIQTSLAVSAMAMPRLSRGVDIPGSKPFLGLSERFKSPVRIVSVDQFLLGQTVWFRVTSAEGATGYCPGNDRLKVTVEMAKRLVNPFFIDKDARDIETLVDDVYTVRDTRGSVYKYAGMPFWNIVGHLEVAIFDMLGRQSEISVGQLLGTPKRKQIPVYISQFGRTTSPQAEVDNAARDLDKTGARATKLKVGERMGNSKKQMSRDRQMIQLARKVFGDEITIYVDANSSYTVSEAIEMGRFFDDHGVVFLEEPVPWQDYRGTMEVAEGLRDRKIKVAGGEQDSSLWQWRDIIDDRIVDIVQPDVFYNGGFVRTLRVARMAAKAGLTVTPHSPKAMPFAAANLQLCSVLPNIGPFQEFRAYGRVSEGMVRVPQDAGLGIAIDEDAFATSKPL